MSKLGKKQLQQRMSKLTAAARAEVAKTEVMHFRLDPQSIERLYGLAGQKRKPVGAMVREWVLERMEQELSSAPNPKSVSLMDIDKRLESIERQLRKR